MKQLIDPFNRRIEYLRISVTDKCNYRCGYCMPEQGAHIDGVHSEYLSYQEITRIVSAFARLGVWKVRLTGGEPLIRKNLSSLAEMLNAVDGIEDISLSTNAEHLHRHASELHIAGVKRLNISMDTLNADKFKTMTRGGNLHQVLKGIDTAIDCGFSPIKINMVVMKNTNFDDIPDMLDYALNKGLYLRFIETMPIGMAGISVMDEHVSADAILNRVREVLGQDLAPVMDSKQSGPARIYRVNGYQPSIGVISAVSQHFCETCNRVRLTARGQLALCLGQEDMVDLRSPLREGVSDAELESIILGAIARKPERHHFNENRHNIQFRQMVSLGG